MRALIPKMGLSFQKRIVFPSNPSFSDTAFTMEETPDCLSMQELVFDG